MVISGETRAVSGGDPLRSGRAKYLTGAVLAALAFVLCFYSFDLGHDWGDDFAEYIAQAMALWNGNIPDQIAASSFIIGHTPLGYAPVVYPWGFPLMLAPVYGQFGMSLTAFKQVGIACYALFVFFSFLYFEKRLGGLWAAALGLLFAVNPVMVRATNTIGSDVPFLLFSTLSLMSMEALLSGGSARRQYAFGTLSGVLMLAAFLIRTNALLLMPALLLTQALTLPRRCERRWFARTESPVRLAQALPYLIFIPAYLLIVRVLPGGGESHLQYAALINWERIRSNALFYVTLLKKFMPVPRGASSLYLAMAALFFLGVARQARRFPLPLIYALDTLALYLLWPSQQGLRFLFPLLPVWIMFIALGCRELATLVFRARSILLDRAMLAFVLCLCALLGLSSVRAAEQNLARGRVASGGAYSRGAMTAYDYVESHTPKSAAIAFRKPRALYLNTCRLGFTPGVEIERLKDADYLLIVSNLSFYTPQVTDKYTPGEIEAQTGLRLELLHQDADFTLYQVEPSPQGA
jgi:hypothetical protein